MVKNIFIPQKVHFVWHENCGWCHKQIEDLGNTWQDYVDSGLTHECKNILGGKG